MIALVLAILLAFASPRPAELAAGIERTAPHLIAADVQLEHALAATIAGAVYNVPPELLLSIAHHESRYQHATVTREEGGKVSCGVMTPVPTQSSGLCQSATTSPLAGYLHGAKHLRHWIDAARGDVRVALMGYAGGYRMIRNCRLGPFVRRRGKVMIDLCQTPEVFAARAARIKWRPADS